MKLLCIILTITLLVLGAHYSVLYLDNKTLQQQLAQQQADFDTRLQEERETYQKKIDSLQEFIAFGQNTLQPTKQTTLTANPVVRSSKLDEFASIQQENLTRTLEKKYALLMSRLGLSGQARNQLQELLLQREQILGATSIGYYSSQADTEAAIRKQQESLAEIDRQIAQLLDSPEDRKTYELLKDSAYEQYQMNDFFDRAQGGSAIPTEKRELLLLSKLEQKQEFTHYLEMTGQRINAAPAEEKPFLIEKAREALHDYKDNYLNTARTTLDEAQYNALREYEQQHFEDMWESLKAGWGEN
ncbi:hypothetical protein [Cellvibrio sp. PSBB023]|uniref:hypothetical protein n=1 Tax=Cellvibrio sp. PSBB023 TaxID=1945512 RepID=UPI00098E9C4D|nr:hypothetical protein [Cellvibrio sp. PSBB023]AQT59062.1 hypothetical protein B0D95_02405 [Cellvibrio sp. PSBB023]